MSPLVRSLLALAALLAAVNADCAEKMIGHETSHPVTLPEQHVDPAPRYPIDIENMCAPGSVIGEKIIACSQIDGDTCLPTIDTGDGTQYTPIPIGCPCNGGCKVYITQFC